MSDVTETVEVPAPEAVDQTVVAAPELSVSEGAQEVPLFNKEDFEAFLDGMPTAQLNEDENYLPDMVMLYSHKKHRAKKGYVCAPHGLPIVYQAICPETLRIDAYHRLSTNVGNDENFDAFLACRCSQLQNKALAAELRNLIESATKPKETE